MSDWYMLTLVGADRAGIVAHITAALYEGGCNLGETSMMRIGGSFTIMMMTQFDGTQEGLERLLEPAADALSLHAHVDVIEGKLHSHVEPNVAITLFGADRAGIVAQATGALAKAGLNITHLESDVGGSEEEPIYIMQIEGVAVDGVDALGEALEELSKEGIETSVKPMDTLIG